MIQLNTDKSYQTLTSNMASKLQSSILLPAFFDRLYKQKDRTVCIAMAIMSRKLIFTVCLLTFALIGHASGQATGKNPVIIIPGIQGSKLVNPGTGRTVWFSVRRDKDDDLRLPMASPVLARNRDSLQATDIIRSVGTLPFLPDIEVYQSLIDALQERGYKEATWDNPQAADVFYVFPYDWRRDNVESAHLLIRKMAAAKRSLRKPGLKFDIIAHSMGGLVARYAAMYGASPLPVGRAVPNWSGAAHINKLMMFGTPNEGSFGAMDALLNGHPIVANRRLPLIDDLKPEDIMTSPAVYQLLPHPASTRILDGNLKPMNVDLYNVSSWIKYGWGPISDPKFLGKLRDSQRLSMANKDIKPQVPGPRTSREDRLIHRLSLAQVRAFLTSALDRARRFHLALDAPSRSSSVQLFAYGGNCEPTLDAMALIYDASKDRWTTLLEAKDIKTSAGVEIKKDVVREALYTEGDGRVTKRSLLGERETNPGSGSTATGRIAFQSSFLACGSHTKLFLEKPIQDSFFSALVVEQKAQP
jgi:pimeloyl-ACP methyl ester carboxylesterase